MRDKKTYGFSDIDLISALVVLPHDERIKKLQETLNYVTVGEIINDFSSFIDMAHTVIENNREMVELIGITEMGMHPHDVQKINLPDLMGALVGLRLAADIPQENLCHGCAYRKGSPANTCLPTTHDAHMCIENDETFFCHENIKEGEAPTRKCRGHLKNKKQGNGVH